LRDVLIVNRSITFHQLTAPNIKEENTLQMNVQSVREGQSEEDVPLTDQSLATFSLQTGGYCGSKVRLADLFANTKAPGQKSDVVFCQLRTSLFFGEQTVLEDQLDQAHALVRDGGDWERKNRVKVWEGLTLCLNRRYAIAASRSINTLPKQSSWLL
jgi:26S proteasome regulatory subunit N7